MGLHHCEADVVGACQVVTTGRGLELSTLQKQLDQQQSQIDKILKSLSKIESVLNQSASHSHNPNYQFTTEGLPICVYCHKPGHVLCQCRQGTRPRTSRVPSPQPDEHPAPAGHSSMLSSKYANDLSNTGPFKQPLSVLNVSRPLIVEVEMGNQGEVPVRYWVHDPQSLSQFLKILSNTGVHLRLCHVGGWL